MCIYEMLCICAYLYIHMFTDVFAVSHGPGGFTTPPPPKYCFFISGMFLGGSGEVWGLCLGYVWGGLGGHVLELFILMFLDKYREGLWRLTHLQKKLLKKQTDLTPQEACSIHFHLFWRLSDFMVPSYGQKNTFPGDGFFSA